MYPPPPKIAQTACLESPRCNSTLLLDMTKIWPLSFSLRPRPALRRGIRSPHLNHIHLQLERPHKVPDQCRYPQPLRSGQAASHYTPSALVILAIALHHRKMSARGAVYGASGIQDCSSLPIGSQICLIGQCLLYQVKDTDTCDSIVAAAHLIVSPSTFVAWNPNINPLCSNLPKLVGYYICFRFV